MMRTTGRTKLLRTALCEQSQPTINPIDPTHRLVPAQLSYYARHTERADRKHNELENHEGQRENRKLR